MLPMWREPRSYSGGVLSGPIDDTDGGRELMTSHPAALDLGREM